MKSTTILAFLMLATIITKAQDLRVDVNQTTFDKIVSSAKFPMTLFEHRDPFEKTTIDFEKNIILTNDATTESLTSDKSRSVFKWAVEDKTKANDQDAIVKNALQSEWDNIRNQIQLIIEENDKVVKGTITGIKKDDLMYQDYSIEDLKKLQDASVEETFKFFYTKEKGAFDIKAHLSYFKLDLKSAPQLKVTSPTFDINNIRVEPTVTGEIWSKLPVFNCCRKFAGICVCIRVTWEWKKIASLTVSPDIGADATITFSEANLKIIAKANLKKLFLDYVILRDINLAGIANRFLNNKTFEVYDASAFVASLPYINSNFRIESLSIPNNPNGLTVQINIKQ